MKSTVELELESQTEIETIINDFSITVGTVNGSGSQTSNLTLLRALFKMGIPVSGKNLFPSNIQGLPTWYTIRVNKEGYLARKDENEIVVAMNPDTFEQDLKSVIPGGVFLYADHIKKPINRDDVILYTMPAKKISRDSDAPTKLRDYVANMVYVGVLAKILGIDLSKIKEGLEFHFKGKSKPVDLNFNVVQTSFNWAEDNLVQEAPYQVQELDLTKDFIMADGNTAAALGSIYGGVQFVSWYPITPATSLPEALQEYLPKLRKDPVENNKNTFAVIQAEDELAAIGMSIGAGWAGLRAMTSTSGPGLSLMAEFAGLAYFAEVPVVIWDVQRVGPSTGLPTRTAQGDLLFAHFLGHGDTQQIILLPGSVNECFEFGWKAFDIAEQLQSPVFVLSDLDFGMNQWMVEPFNYPDQPMKRGKVLWENELEELNGIWARYKDIDGDGIPNRTVPGNRHPSAAYFARGTGHDENARYTENPEKWLELMERLKNKFITARSYVPEPVIEQMVGSEIGIVGFGSTEPAINEARIRLSSKDMPTDFMRIRSIPFNDQVGDFLDQFNRVYVIEMNRDGQLNRLLAMEYPEHAAKLRSIAFLDGLPLTATFVENALFSREAN
jgi:2-oxoglutarate ferredoxin oxidoreductase subunit alpha